MLVRESGNAEGKHTFGMAMRGGVPTGRIVAAKERIFGKVRCMTSESARRKLRLKQYLAEHSPPLKGG